MKHSDLIPAQWEFKQLGKLCENLDSKRIPITKSKRKKGNIPYYGASGIVDYVADYLFDEDLLLVSEDGANLIGRVYPIAFSISGKVWVNNHAHVLRFSDQITQTFVEYYLNSISLIPYIRGMAQPKLNQKALLSIPIPIPPLSEQKRIVEILDEAFEGIDRAIANTQKNLLTDSPNKSEITTSSHFLLKDDIRKNSIFPVGTTIFPKRGGASVPQINNYDISPLIIPFPKDREKQIEITKTLEVLTSETQRLETIYQRKLEALQELKQSLLHKAFTGELTNPSTSLRNNPTVKEVAA
jgi:restriction endonuclease S subunit